MAANELKINGGLEIAGSDPLTLPKASSDPVSGIEGQVYYNTSTGQARIYSNGSWVDLSSGTSGSGVNINLFTLSGTNITNKSVTLTSAPSTPSKTQVNVIGGVIQEYGADFTISGSTLSWSSLGLETLLVAGDKLVVQFD